MSLAVSPCESAWLEETTLLIVILSWADYRYSDRLNDEVHLATPFDTLCIVCTRGCLQREAGRNRCGSDHSSFEGGEFSVGHVAEPFRDRIGRKMQIQRLRWPAITAVQKRRRGVKACRIRVVVLRKVNQCIDRQTRKLAGFYHQVANGPAVCAAWVVGIRSEFQRVFRPAARVSTTAFFRPQRALRKA